MYDARAAINLEDTQMIHTVLEKSGINKRVMSSNQLTINRLNNQ